MSPYNISVDVFLMLLLKNEKFSNYIINNCQEIEADIRSYRQDPNCSCKHKISKYFEKNKDIVHVSLQNWLNENKQTLSDLTGLEEDLSELDKRNILKPSLPKKEWNKYKDVIGEVIEILPDPEEYKKVISIAREKWFYNGLNILETIKLDNSGIESTVWLLLFY